MFRNIFSQYLLNPFFLTLIFSLQGLTTGALAATQNVAITWNPPVTTVNFNAVRVILNNVQVCKTFDTTAREILCPVTLTDGPNEFKLEAFTVPVAQALQETVNEDSSSNLFLKATSQDNAPLTYAVVTPPSLGDLTLINPSTGAYRYTPHKDVSGADSFTFRANDGKADSNTAEVNLVILPVNDPPMANASQDQTVPEGSTVSLDGDGSLDIDGGIASCSWTQLSGPAVLLTDNKAMRPNFTTPDVGPSGANLTFELAVADAGGLVSKDTVSINVSWVNSPPVAIAGSDQNAIAGDPVTLDGTLSYDTDDGLASVQWLQKSGTPVTISNPTGMTTTFAVPATISAPESLNFDLIVTDHGGLKHTDSCIITVSPKPSTTRNVVVNWDAPAPSGREVLAFRVNQNNVFLCETLDKTARQITCPVTIAENRNEVNVFSVETVYAQTAQASKPLSKATTDVTASSSPAGAIAATPNSLSGESSATGGDASQAPLSSDVRVTVNEDDTVEGFLAATDKDSAKLTYSILSAPISGKVELLDQTTGEFRYTPSPDANGQETFSYSASDGVTASAPATVTVAILPVNDPSVADAGPDQTINEGETVSLDATNSHDIDDAIVSVHWTQLDGPSVTLSDTSSSQPKFEALDVVGTDSVTLTFQVTITDASGAESSDTSLVNVVWVNTPPVADAGTDQNAFEGEFVTLDASNSQDSDSDGIASFSWKQIAGPSISLSDNTAKQPNLITPDVVSDGTSLVYELTVTDSEGLIAQDTVIINVTWVNSSPVAHAGQNQTVPSAATVRLDGTQSYDADDGIASVQWRQTAGTPVTLSNPTDLQPTFKAPATGWKTIPLTFELLVKDFGGLRHADTCVIQVLPSKNGRR